MAKISVLGSTTSKSILILIQDSSSTTGVGLSGLVFNSSGLTAYYSFAGTAATATAITLATLSAVNSAYSSGGFKEIDATHMKGVYRLDIPNAALAASNGQTVTIYLYGATNMAPVVLEIELTATDNQDGLRGGMTAIVNYLNSNIWLDTTNGASGTVLYTNGTYNNPSNTIANATTIAGNIGIKRFFLIGESSITLAQTYRDYVFDGFNWTLALGSQDISSTTFNNATFSGTGTAAHGAPYFTNCTLSSTNATLPPCTLRGCGIGGTLTAGSTGTFALVGCYANGGTPIFDLGSAHSGAQTVNISGWTGALTLKNILSGDTVTVDGTGSITLDSSCTGGTVIFHGDILVTNNGSGMTITSIVPPTNFSVQAIDSSGRVDLGKWKGGTIATPNITGVPLVDLDAIQGVAIDSRFQRAVDSIAIGTVGTGSTTTNVVVSSTSPTTTVTNQWARQVMAFDRNTTTANLRGVKAVVQSSDTSNNIVVEALPAAPVSTDTFTLQ